MAAGEAPEAGKRFEQLRTLGWQADLDLPICDRLQPIAAERGLPADWRLAPPTPEDIGLRPPLAELGPFRWQPHMAAPSWQLPDAGEHASFVDRNIAAGRCYWSSTWVLAAHTASNN